MAVLGTKIEQLRRELIVIDSSYATTKQFLQEANGLSRLRNLSNEEIILELKRLEIDVLKSIWSNEKVSSLVTGYKRKNWSNLRCTLYSGVSLIKPEVMKTRQISTRASPRHISYYWKLLRIISILVQLLETKATITKRDLYYTDSALFVNQNTVDRILNDISSTLQIRRNSLPCVASPKGLISGDFKFLMKNGSIMCGSYSSKMQNIPQVMDIEEVESTATFVLVIEKEAIFQRLLDGNIENKLGSCILMTGKGYPDICTRSMLVYLWDNLKLPSFVLTDADPYGLEIMCIYKYGSQEMAFESSNLCLPLVKWIGILPSEFSRLGMPERLLVPMAEFENNRLKCLMKRPYIVSNNALLTEAQALLECGQKAEIEAFYDASFNFLLDTYLSHKLRIGLWI